MRRDWRKTKYRSRIKEYLFLANRMKRRGCRVMLSSVGPYSASRIEEGDGHPFDVIYHWESHGELLPTSNRVALEWIMIGKAARDWHVEEWGLGMVERVVTRNELLEDGVPASLVESAVKRRNSRFFSSPA